ARIKPDMTAMATLVGSLQQELHRHGYGLQTADPSPPGSGRLEASMGRIDAEFRPSYYLLVSVPGEVQRWVAESGVPGLVLGARAADVQLPAIELDQAATMRHA